MIEVVVVVVMKRKDDSAGKYLKWEGKSGGGVDGGR